MPSAWKQLHNIAPEELMSAYQQAHQLAQWLARFARGYLPAQPDDSHTSLMWHRNMGLMTTNATEIGGRQISFGLELRDLSLVKIEDGQVVDSIFMHGQKDGDAGEWMCGAIDAMGLDGSALNAALPYELPASPYSNGCAYNTANNVAALSEIARYLDNTSLVLNDVVAKHQNIHPGPAPVRLWPHHFDLATIITLEEGDFESAHAVGFGLAVPDPSRDEFYFYTYPWPRNQRTDLPALRSDSAYQYDGTVGAVQMMSKLVSASDQEATARIFFDDTVGTFIRLLQSDMAAR